MRGSPERQIKEKVSFFIQGLSTGVSLSMDFLIEYEDCPCFIRPMQCVFPSLMPSPSAFSKFVLSVLKFLGILKFLSYTQNILGVLK